MVWYGAVLRGVVWYGMDWYGVAQCSGATMPFAMFGLHLNDVELKRIVSID